MSKYAETRWYVFAWLAGFGGLVWPSVIHTQTDSQIMGCLLMMFICWAVGDILKAIRNRSDVITTHKTNQGN